MKKAMIPIFASIIVFVCTGYVQAGTPNPADVYCYEMGYQAKTITEQNGGQYSICVFPDEKTCDAWKFMQGRCGKEYSYCALNGYKQIVKTDGKNPFSRTYAVCTNGSEEIGNPLDLMGITEELLKPIPEDELPTPDTLSPPKAAQPLLPGMPGVPPSAFDWRTYLGFDWMTPVKNQSACGSCWAFSAVGTMEATYNIRQNQPNLDINLSEEYVNADCNSNGSHGCCGGWHSSALDAIRDNGVPDENCLVYDVTNPGGYGSGDCSCYPNPPCPATCPNGGGTNDDCSMSSCDDACFDLEHRLVNITGRFDIGDSVDDIKAALISHGPLAICLNWGFAGSSSDGVDYCNDDSGSDTHCVVLTGWDDTLENGLTDGSGDPLYGAWITKNSHGNTNGPNNDGYRFVAYNDCTLQDNVLGVTPANIDFPSLSIPNDITFGDTCVGGTSHETLNICNTGKADLSIYDVTSNNAQFQLTEPLQSCWDMDGNGNVDIPQECSGGMPALISPDFCYPFEIQFTPTSASTQTAELAVRSSDIGKPTVTVDATGNGVEPGITTSIANSGNFGNVCIGGFKDLDLTINNSGDCDLEITGISSSDAQFQVPSGFSAVIGPGDSQAVSIRYQPSGVGADSATITVNGNAGTQTVSVTGNSPTAILSTSIADSGDFGEVCSGLFRDLDLTVNNDGLCPLSLTSATLTGTDAADFSVTVNSGTIIESGNSTPVSVRFTPTSFMPLSPRQATVNIAGKTQGASGSLPVDSTAVQGSVPPPDIQVAIANDGDFGEVCAEDYKDLNITLFNQGRCDLTISDISIIPPGGSFELPGDVTFPLVLSHDADFTLPVRYAPDVCSDADETATVVITSDDPDENPVNIGISGSSPCPNLIIDPIELSELYGFPATVVDATGSLGCYSEKKITLRNNGNCPLTIDDISAAGADYAVMAPTVFPVILPTGEETLEVTVRFTPLADGDPLAPSEVTGLLTIISDDPDASGEAALCGESTAQSGVRILVTDISSGTPWPLDSVDSITLSSKGKNLPSPINLRFTDQPLFSATVCGNDIVYHINQETLPEVGTTGSDPKSSYSTKAKEGNLQAAESFTLGQCEFRDFQLQLLDDDSPVCLLKAKGEACETDGECCSGRCKGKAGVKTCR